MAAAAVSGVAGFDGFGDVVDCLTYRLDLLCGVIGDINIELLLKLHHQLNRVKGVGSEIIDERRFPLNLVLAHAKLLGNDINHTFFD